ncbi:tetratricopeptide repeat protein [Sanyastnella coralliicola]|uniref:tetratricopeptide repeat protein n=1 Tax=Sanyastnella coralliicola TaxID=3069118 RepID=UPI0027B99436|nr:tetratricopeptide repeat protein [Longitalea sp. SCSIO 12813]
MKKTLLGLLVTITSMTAFGQASVTSAFNANQAGSYDEAVGYIEKSLSNEKAITKEKTWRYRGDIYMNVALDSALAIKYPEALDLARESYIKARELDKRGSYANEIQLGLNRVMNQAMNNGIANYNSKNYNEAAKNFALSNKVAQTAFDSTFTQAVYNTALAYEKGGETDMAIDYYRQCIEANYLAEDVYLLIANLYSNSDREKEALETLKEARMKFPRNKNLILEELNIYLRNEQYDLAEENLRLAIEADPKNEVLHFSQGAVNDKLGNIEVAEKAYLNAIEIKPDYVDARYNLGALYYNIGAEMINEANEIPPTQVKRYEAKVAEAKELFAKAQPHFEEAHKLDPEDLATMESLKNIYARTGQDDAMLEMSAKLKKAMN